MSNPRDSEPSLPLPSEDDFDPWGGDLDAQCAWRHFGGMTLEEAARKFRERPDIYQEDFMFMGGKAFAFYFPIIDEYLRDVPEVNEDDDRQAWILAHGIKNQFHPENIHHFSHLANRVIALTDFVLENTARFGYDAEERERIADAWTELAAHLRDVTRR